jgi:rare lipoprotein A
MRRTVLTLAVLAGLAAPVPALAQSTGGAPSAPETPSAPPSGDQPSTPVDGTVRQVARASSDPTGAIVLDAAGAVIAGTRVTVRGTTQPARANAAIVLERLDSKRGWTQAAAATTGRDGRFTARWRAGGTGEVRLRARLAGDGGETVTSGELAVVVYRRGETSWYGPGFYGRKTACGQRLRATTIGVAHKTLPCGTLVDVLYGGKTIVVPVIDRGPYVRGRTWDLTYAVAKSLGLLRVGVADVGTLQVGIVTRR